jgi:hypothetical protein
VLSWVNQAIPGKESPSISPITGMLNSENPTCKELGECHVKCEFYRYGYRNPGLESKLKSEIILQV